MKKIQNLWNFILKKKKESFNTNIFFLKNSFNLNFKINNSLIFFINNFKNLKLKKIIVNNLYILIFFYNFVLFIIFVLMLSIFFI